MNERKNRLVWVTTILYNEHNFDIRVFATEGEAKEYVYRFVECYWSDNFYGEDLPVDKDVAIRRYFEDNDELLHIEECLIEGGE